MNGARWRRGWARRGRALAMRGDNARLHAEAAALRRRLRDAQGQAALLLALARARLARSMMAPNGGFGGVVGHVAPADLVGVAPPPPQQMAGGAVVASMMTS